MSNRLWVRFSLMFATLILLGAVINFVATRQLVDRNFRPSLTEERLKETRGLLALLSQFYATQGDWDGVDAVMRGAQSMSWNGPGGPTILSLVDTNDQLVYGQQVITEIAAQGVGRLRIQQTRRYAIQADGQTVGYLQVSQLNRSPPAADETRFEGVSPGDPQRRPAASSSFWPDEFSRWLIIVALLGTTVSIGLSVWFSRHLTAPLAQLADAAKAIGAGDLQQRVQISSRDEIGALAASFNNMAADLEEAETLRRNLLADVAHELRTPLSVVQGNLSALLDGVYPLENQEIARIYNQTRLLSRLVDDLRELAQAEAGQLPLHRQRMDLHELLTDTLTTFAGAAQSQQIELRLETAPGAPAVEADPTRLRQVLHNLLANALRHTPAQGTVTLRTEPVRTETGRTETVRTETGRTETVHTEASQGQARIYVTDTGTGIAPEHLPHVFDRFYRADSARDRDHGGSGLGLSIARALIEAHGGTLVVTSPGVEQGTTFTVTLPLAAAQAEQPVASPQ